MRAKILLHRSISITLATALVATMPGIASAAPARARPRSAPHAPMARIGTPVGTQRPTSEVLLSIGQGELVTLPADVNDVWVSSPEVADVYVNNPHQIHLFGKGSGEATLFATSKSGGVIYSTNIRVSQNITSIDRMLKLAMPEADIKVVTTGQLAVLTGTVATPDDSAQAQRLVTMLLNPGVDASSPGAMLKIAVFNRLRTATPLQVNLQVRIAEVSRSFVKNIGVNLQSYDATSGFKTGIASGRTAATQYTPGGGLFTGGTTATTGTSLLSQVSNGTTLGAAGKLFGLNLIGALDLGETIGQVTTLANPNLTVLSGETASFLAGGEIPIVVSQGIGAVSVEYKQYGVSLSYTPTVLSDGRISLRVRPEVSQLTSVGSVTIGSTVIQGLTTRRVETTAELGSGQSMVIGGLLQNDQNNQITKTPGLGDVPVLGTLFRSNAWQRNETELMIVITPYLVKPVNANDIVLPTDGYKAPTDLDRVLFGQLGGGTTGGSRPKPSMAPPVTVTPALGAAAPVTPGDPMPTPAEPMADDRKAAVPSRKTDPKKAGASVAPGFSLN